MSCANNIFSDKNFYLKNLIIEKKENYIYNYPFLKDFLKNKKFIYKLDFKYSPLLSNRDFNLIISTKIQYTSAKLHLKNLKGGVKWIICSYEFSDNFYDCAGFNFITFGEINKDLSKVDCIKIGTLFQKYNIYKTNLIPDNVILCGNDNLFGMIEIK